MASEFRIIFFILGIGAIIIGGVTYVDATKEHYETITVAAVVDEYVKDSTGQVWEVTDPFERDMIKVGQTLEIRWVGLNGDPIWGQRIRVVSRQE